MYPLVKPAEGNLKQLLQQQAVTDDHWAGDRTSGAVLLLETSYLDAR